MVLRGPLYLNESLKQYHRFTGGGGIFSCRSNRWGGSSRRRSARMEDNRKSYAEGSSCGAESHGSGCLGYMAHHQSSWGHRKACEGGQRPPVTASKTATAWKGPPHAKERSSCSAIVWQGTREYTVAGLLIQQFDAVLQDKKVRLWQCWLKVTCRCNNRWDKSLP